MKLLAYMVVHNELDRYLIQALESLMGYCDEIAIWDDGSTDGTPKGLVEEFGGNFHEDGGQLRYRYESENAFFDHEGRLRQRALDWALQSNPTHVLAIDADELILEGQKLREQLEQGRAFSLCMREVWKARPDTLEIRQDGGWCEHPVPILWKNVGRLPLHNRKLASGRAPAAISTLRPRFTDVAIYHFGWANSHDREARYQRYVKHDGGRYHRNSHIQSILWPDMDITATLETVEVPGAWVDRANRAPVRSGYDE